MPSILQIMDGIEKRLETIAGLRVTEYKPDTVNPPQAVVGVPDEILYHQTFANGQIEVRPTITLLVSRTSDRAGQRLLADFGDSAGSRSVRAAIETLDTEGRSTLGGVVSDCAVQAFRPFSFEEAAGIGYYGGVFSLLVLASGV